MRRAPPVAVEMVGKGLDQRVHRAVATGLPLPYQIVTCVTMRCILLALLLPLAAPACAAADEDPQLWTVLSASGKLHDRLMGYVDAVVRTSSEQDAVASAEATAMLGLHISERVTLWAGGGLSCIRVPGGREGTLHRGRQQLNLALGKLGRATLTTRTMVEERWWLGRGGAGMRIRQQLRISAPVGRKKTAIFLTTEPIWNLNSTSWGQRQGLNRLRSSIGLSLALTPHLRGDFGYLNDYDFRPSRIDREIHAALMTFAVSF